MIIIALRNRMYKYQFPLTNIEFFNVAVASWQHSKNAVVGLSFRVLGY